ncbi:hypothetical protein [Algibacter pacificus]|uniref:hypothetical protein n=1 Tax=Algibacter pacificus TaxID=2599389 RepID=UPI0011CC1D33|nr:hypothetical protein [Algibacter pacificus]
MNYIKLFLGLTLLTTFFCCDKLDELTKFEMTLTEEVVIKSNTVINLPFYVETPDITTNSESTFESNNTRKDLIESITLTDLELKITVPETGNFNFLKSIKIYMSAENEDEMVLAWLDEVVANDAGILFLETSTEDLKNYIKSDKITLRTESVTDELITEDHHIDIKSTFFVDAKILGL